MKSKKNLTYTNIYRIKTKNFNLTTNNCIIQNTKDLRSKKFAIDM